jgi:RNA polymerase sigma-70 factor (ECF subfamily)
MDDTQHEGQGPAGFAETALPLLDHVARFARHLTRDPADADDLVQETYLRALRGWHTFAPGSDCRRWLFTVCRNAFLQGLRGQKPVAVEAPELEALAAAVVHAGAVESGLGDMFGRMDLRETIDRGLAGLPEAFREAIVLVDLEDLSYEEAAEVTGVPVGTVRSRLFRGRRLLQETLLTHAKDAGLVPERAHTIERGAP